MDTIDIVLATAEMRRRARIRDEYSRRVRPVPEWTEEAELAAWPTPETIRELQAGLRLAQGLPVLGWRSLLRFAGGEYLLQQTERASTHLLEQQRSTLVEVPEFDEPVPFLHVSSRLASERKRVLREALENAATAVIQSFHNTYREFWSHLFTTAEGLGYPNLLALWEEISGISSEDFCKSLEAILRETEYTYRERMQWHLKRVLGIRLEDARRHDILALFGTDTTGAWFPRADLLPCLQRWLRDWGWELNEHPNMHVEQYPSIAGVAWCAPLEIPVDIRLAVAPAEGMWAYAQALRESAKSMLLASLPADTPQDLRCFPDPSWLEAQAEVCGGLVRTSRWIQTYRHISQPEEGLNLVQLERLFIVRRYLGKCLYERTFYEDANLDGKDEAYRDALRRACGFAYPETYYLHDIDPGFSTFWNARGWLLGANVRQHLQQLYAEEWFSEPDALLALQDLWRHSPYRPSEALLQPEQGPLWDVDAIVADLLCDL